MRFSISFSRIHWPLQYDVRSGNIVRGTGSHLYFLHLVNDSRRQASRPLMSMSLLRLLFYDLFQNFAGP